MSSLSAANGAFAFRLLKLLCPDDPADNVFFSPVSVSSVMAMVLLGAKGDTGAQIAQVLALNPKGDIHGGFQSLLTQVNRPGAPFSLSIANRLFADKNWKFLPSCTESCLKFYRAEVDQLPIAEDPEKSRKHINTWASKRTEGKIQELLAEGSLGKGIRLILVNAVYFKGRWDQQFEESSTRTMPFKINQKEQRPVQMMYQEARLPLAYVRELGTQVLELPYTGRELSMVIVLPVEGVDLSTVEKSLTFEKFQSWTSAEQMKSTEVEVFLPRFKLQEDYDMGSVLQRLGMVHAFDDACDSPLGSPEAGTGGQGGPALLQHQPQRPQLPGPATSSCQRSGDLGGFQVPGSVGQ
ncbi:serpin B9-like [Heterocephalus glaber]|uniref:Serpin B9-like n=1 Tax=Heterocephalus glaber TaxID=10181 RepID=A0AAX6PB22_HETGA|nr:serpin B9-like [Heterocephalus glaber]